MKQSIRLGTYAGVPVGVHWSVAVIFGLVSWELADGVFPGAYAGTPTEFWTAAIVAAVAFFASLLAHEVSHAVVARRHGVAVRSITLWLFGGVAQLGGDALTAGADFRIAAAGPAMSFFLVGAFAALEWAMSAAGVHGLVLAVPSWLWKINLLLAAFNLIPAAPLDGGRILRSGIWLKSHDRTRATVLAARTGRVFGVLLIALGAAGVVAFDDLYALWPALLGWFLYNAARAEESAAVVRRDLESLRVADVMTVDPPVLPSSTTVADLVHRHLPWYRTDVVALVGPTGWLDGVLPVERIRHLPPLAHADTPAGAIAHPISSLPVGRPEDAVPDLLRRMADCGGVPGVVLDSSNRLAGILTLGDVQRGVQTASVRAGRPDHV